MTVQSEIDAATAALDPTGKWTNKDAQLLAALTTRRDTYLNTALANVRSVTDPMLPSLTDAQRLAVAAALVQTPNPVRQVLKDL
jgi:hypothetical protein